MDHPLRTLYLSLQFQACPYRLLVLFLFDLTVFQLPLDPNSGRHTRDIIFQTCGTFGFANFSDTTNSIWYFDREHYHTIPFHSECVIHCFILQMLNSISATLERIFVCFCVFAWDCVVCSMQSRAIMSAHWENITLIRLDKCELQNSQTTPIKRTCLACYCSPVCIQNLHW